MIYAVGVASPSYTYVVRPAICALAQRVLGTFFYPCQLKAVVVVQSYGEACSCARVCAISFHHPSFDHCRSIASVGRSEVGTVHHNIQNTPLLMWLLTCPYCFKYNYGRYGGFDDESQIFLHVYGKKKSATVYPIKSDAPRSLDLGDGR